MDPLLNMAALLFAGLLFSRLIKLLKLPNVTGFLVGGLIIGPSVLGLLSTQGVESLGLISSVALGFIAFSIGSEFKISYFRRVGFLPIVIATFESLFAVVFVVAALAAAGQTLPFSLVLGAIAAATAPAATIMVIKQYRAKGPVTETLLSVVALDDATALIFFGIAVAIAQALESPQHASLLFSVLSPVLQILAALGIGLALGAAHTLLIRFLPARHNRLVLTIAFVLTATAVAELLGLSALLTTMAMGAVFANFCKQSAQVMELTDRFTNPIYMMFFVLSGAGLNLSILPSIGLVGVIYVVVRVLGKMAGAWFGATLMHGPAEVRRYLGPALLPQAGVAIGLTVVAQQVVPQYAEVIRAVILCGTLIYELIGPGVAKWALQKAGEIEKGA